MNSGLAALTSGATIVMTNDQNIKLDEANNGANARAAKTPMPADARGWLATLAGAAMAVVALTTLVAVLHRPAKLKPADVFAIKEVPTEIDGHEVTTDFGRQLFMRNCSTCHAADLSGMPNQGANLVRSAFVTSRSNTQLMVFLRTGRAPGDRNTVLGLTMPPRGGNPHLDDAELADIVAYLRLVQKDRAEASRRASQVLGAAGPIRQ
jgi:mono/diheme cytochrome c family protein